MAGKIVQELSVRMSLSLEQAKAQLKQFSDALNGLDFKDKNLEKKFKGIILEADSLFDKVQGKFDKGFKVKADAREFKSDEAQLEKVVASLSTEFDKLFASPDLAKKLNIDPEVVNRIKAINDKLKETKKNLTNATATFKSNKGIDSVLEKMSGKGATKGAQEFAQSFSKLIDQGDIEEAKSQLEDFIATQTRLQKSLNTWNEKNPKKQKNTENVTNNLTNAQSLLNTLNGSGGNLSEIELIKRQIRELDEEFINTSQEGVEGLRGKMKPLSQDLNGLYEETKKTGMGMADMADDAIRAADEFNRLKDRVKMFFGLNNMIYLFRRAVGSAFQAIKDLDEAMTETAVVTDFSVGDMWDELPRYTAAADELGTTTLGAYQTMTLFYQQGEGEF